MKIFAVENDFRNLLLVDGNEVVNGSYKLKLHSDGSASIPYSDKKAYYVMEAPKIKKDPNRKETWLDYNAIFEKVEEILKKEGRL